MEHSRAPSSAPSSDISIAPSATTRSSSLFDEAIWFLQPDHHDEMQFELDNGVPVVRGGTTSALVEYLTRHDKLDTAFNQTFLLTYRSFMTSTQLFAMLMERFYIQHPDGLTQAEYQIWLSHKKKPTQVRVINILKRWLEQTWVEPDDEETRDLLKRIYEFALDSIPALKTPGSNGLINVIERRLQGDRNVRGHQRLSMQSVTSPPPVLPKKMKKIKFLDLNPTELARQLTLLESRLYGKIRLEECLNKAWQKRAGDLEPAPNIRAMIRHSNQLANWVGNLILEQSDLKKRVRLIKHFIEILEVRPFDR